MIQNNIYIKTNRSKQEIENQYTTVPILGPQERLKLDRLKRIRSNSEKGNKSSHRDSIRPQKNIKVESLDKKRIYEQLETRNKEDSGITKQFSFQTSKKPLSVKKKQKVTHYEIYQKEEFTKCCSLFGEQRQVPESPFKTARNIILRK